MEQDKLKLLNLLKEKYPNIDKASAEIINLSAIRSLPKGTEHFMSDLHGEYCAFNHIINNCSGVIKEKIDMVLSKEMTEKARQTLATLIYYPREKLEEIKKQEENLADFYRVTINQLIKVCQTISSKYSRSRVRKILPTGYDWLLDELLHADHVNINREAYYENIIDTIVSVGREDSFIITISEAIKALAVDRLHIVGDIYDRGRKPDKIIDLLINHKSCDIQWGNHDIVWMGACSGSLPCIANVLNLSLSYNNIDLLEIGYGISLRPLANFASSTYKNVNRFLPKGVSLTENQIEMAQMRKAIDIIMFKLEGQAILRNPHFNMQDRLLLNKIDFENGTIELDGKTHPLLDTHFPTIDKDDPYKLSSEEELVMQKLHANFVHSNRLKKHIRFLYEKGSIYLVYNKNLLFHGAIPMNKDFTFCSFTSKTGEVFKGKDYLDYCDKMARQAHYAKSNTKEKLEGQDFCWYLWCGSISPLYGRAKMTTFERLLIEDTLTHKEKKNDYYSIYNDKKTFEVIAKEFNLDKDLSHIINGHVPVKSIEGESPLKANGKIIVIDGGFCQAYHKTTGIAGYTLIYNSWGLRLSAHTPFTSKMDAVKNNIDIHSTVTVFERSSKRITISETDIGKNLEEDINYLKMLVKAFLDGTIKESSL